MEVKEREQIKVTIQSRNFVVHFITWLVVVTLSLHVYYTLTKIQVNFINKSRIIWHLRIHILDEN